MALRTLKICTHDGRFHADEALAVFLLKQLDIYSGAQVLRSRNADAWASSDIVVDVGGIYDPSKNLFDHHQRDFQDTFSPLFFTKLSSAGLIYKHYGSQVISSLYASLKGTYPEAPQLTETLIEKLYVKIYRELVEEYDAVDNGISAFPPDLTPKYRVGASSVFSRVNNLNAEWNAPEEMAEETLARFMKAVNICGETFTDIFVHYWTSWLPARDIVVEALRNRCHLHPSGRIISLSRSCPWKEHLYEIETELGLEGDIVYCLYSDVLHGKTMIQSVPIHSTSFQSRFALPDPWRGLRDEKLDSILGFEGAVFTHASGFIGGHANMEGALRMAERALQFHRLI